MFERHRVSLGDRVSPIQLWPRGFDLAFEWYNTRTEEYEGETLAAHLNLGFFPGGDRPYFYSNPWPFDPALTQVALPQGAVWQTDGWNGTMLPYDAVQGDRDPASTLVNTLAPFSIWRHRLWRPGERSAPVAGIEWHSAISPLRVRRATWRTEAGGLVEEPRCPL